MKEYPSMKEMIQIMQISLISLMETMTMTMTMTMTTMLFLYQRLLPP